MYLTPFGERSRKVRPLIQPKRPNPIEANFHRTKKEETPNQLALGNLDKALKTYKISPEAIRNYKSDAKKIDSLRYMNMETLAVTLILHSHLNSKGIGSDFFRQDMVEYVHPYLDYLTLPPEDFDLQTRNLDPNLVEYLRVYRIINEELKEAAKNLVPVSAKYTEKEIENFQNKHSASILRYLRTLYRALLSEAPLEEPEEEL